MSQFIPAKMCETRQEFNDSGRGSVFLWYFVGKESGNILVKCPCCAEERTLYVYNKNVVPHPELSWEISGLPDLITLSPSVNFTNCCRWHGFLIEGQWDCGVFSHYEGNKEIWVPTRKFANWFSK